MNKRQRTKLELNSRYGRDLGYSAYPDMLVEAFKRDQRNARASLIGTTLVAAVFWVLAWWW